MDDTQRLDSLAEHGLCLAGISTFQNGEWSYRWVCHFGIDRSVEASTIRDAIDLSVCEILGVDSAPSDEEN